MKLNTYKNIKFFHGDEAVIGNASVFAALGKRALIVTGKSSADKCGAMADVDKALKSVGVDYVRFSGIPENPPILMCQEGGKLAREQDCDFVIGIGGGSAIDAAKAIAGFAANPQCDTDTLFDDSIRANDCLPIVAIPTTAGTGSEANRYSVLTMVGGDKKKTFRHASTYPAVSIVSPKYLRSLPEKYTVSTALDALAHAIESYLSPKSTEQSEECALYAAREIWDVIFNEDGEEYTDGDRARLSYSATLAGLAIDYTGTGFPHPLGYSITLEYGVPHGAACALFDGAFIEYNYRTDWGKARIDRLASHIGTTAEEMIRRIPERSGVDLRLDGVTRERLIDLVSGAGNYANSPYVINRAEMSEIYTKMLGD